MMELTIGQLLTPAEMPVRKVPIPELKGHCYVRSLTGVEREDFERSFIDEVSNESRMVNFKAKLAALCVCNEQGEPLVSAGLADTTAVNKMANQSARVLERIASVAIGLNALSGEDVEALGGGNSDSGLAEDGISRLQSVSDIPQSA